MSVTNVGRDASKNGRIILDQSSGGLRRRFLEAESRRQLRIIADYGNGFVKVEYTKQDVLKSGFSIGRGWHIRKTRVVEAIPLSWLREAAGQLVCPRCTRYREPMLDNVNRKLDEEASV